MGGGSENRAHRAPSGPTDGDVEDAGEGFAQQLRPYGGHRRAHAEPCTDNLRVSEPEDVVRWRGGRRREDTAPRPRRQSRDRATGQKIDFRNSAGPIYSGLAITPQAMRGRATVPGPPATASMTSARS